LYGYSNNVYDNGQCFTNSKSCTGQPDIVQQFSYSTSNTNGPVSERLYLDNSQRLSVLHQLEQVIFRASSQQMLVQHRSCNGNGNGQLHKRRCNLYRSVYKLHLYSESNTIGNAIANQTVCNNTTTTAVTIAGPVPGTVYNWTNDNTSIGLGANGIGNIGAFNAINNTNAPVTATVTVTPVFTAMA